MATQVFLHDAVATNHRGTNTAGLNAVTSGWLPKTTNTTRGSGVVSKATNTVAGTTLGVETTNGAAATRLEWITPPVDADVTISGTITGNIWANESSNSANTAINFRVHKVAATNGTLTEIVKSARVTELTTTNAAVNFTATPTSTALNKGDRLRITIFGDDAGTMGTGFTFTTTYNGTTGAASGDTYISFNETFGFQTTDPTTTTLYLTDTASDVVTSANDLRTWTSRGDSATTAAETTIGSWSRNAIPLSPLNSWFTPQLEAFTLSGLVKVNLRAAVSNAAANTSVGVGIARVNADGTSATDWGFAFRDAALTSGSAGEVATTETAYTFHVSGDDLAFTDGQRLRVQVFFGACADVIQVAGHTITVYFDGPTGGASGDTYLILGQTLTEYVPPPLSRSNTAEGGTDGVTVTTANSGGASGDAWEDMDSGPTFSNLHPSSGSMGYKFAANFGGQGWLSLTGTTHYGRTYFYVVALPGGDFVRIDWYDNAISALRCSIGIEGDGKIRLRNSALATVATSTMTCSDNQLYRIEYKVVSHASAGTMDCRIYDGHSTSILETVSASGLNTNGGTLEFNRWELFSAAGEVYLDDFNTNATDYPGPSVTAATSLAFGRNDYAYRMQLDPDPWRGSPWRG